MHSAIETLDLDGDREQQRKLLDILKSDIGRLDRLISDISNASRLDAELLRGDMTPFDLGEMLETITEVYEETALPEDMTISLIIPDEEMNIAGIDSHIAQVIRNLLDNAISFNTSGGTITIQAQATDTRIQLTVDDQGPGVDEDKLESIFDRFYSERPEAEDFGNHSGLGLNICKQIIAIHSGEIWAENIYAEGDQDQDALGARFVVSLPQHR
jgi:two-component system sensor histidine kinase ChvG